MQDITFEIAHNAADLPADRGPAPPSMEAQCHARCKASAARVSTWIAGGVGTSLKLYHPAAMRDGTFWGTQVKPPLVAAGYAVNDTSDAQYVTISVPE